MKAFSKQQATGSRPFKYQPLACEDEIRLVEILPPRENSDKVELRIQHEALAVKPKYEALSYEWGSPNGDTFIIWVNDCPFMIRQNLWLALRRLRLRSGERQYLLWIDAICIDQSNVLEKNCQVSQMGAIYSQASTLLIWLGDASEEVAKYLYAFNEIILPYHVDGDFRADSMLKLELIKHICELSYWKRLWIIQEVVLTTNIKVHYGIAQILVITHNFGMRA